MLNRPRPPARRLGSLAAKPQHGVMLIEALVSTLLLMFGILGLIGLQGRLSGAATDAQLRGEATNLADQLISRMWVDQANLSTYEVTAGTCSSSSNTYCSTWASTVSSTLPSGSATVTVSGSTVTVTVRWMVANSTAHQVQTSAVFNY